ncbi:gated channel subfamily H member 8 [Seminavis robusta]|uniref:Gated channel subfamily H member 8 n=1 Tax=Seminavis robusta TaxID=568900 RepID=A0A9N8H500_9STRA|nr:gated channel subfamily H member 8 [Seminavis robusta]|eukprot:Sro128_g061400.1 gated channel subfamily H member 8 (501) ;mRNA; r:101670-103617
MVGTIPDDIRTDVENHNSHQEQQIISDTTTTSIPQTPTTPSGKAMMNFPAVVTPLQYPLVSRRNSSGSSSGRKRSAIQQYGGGPEEEEYYDENRQDEDSLPPRPSQDTRRVSPRSSPIAVLKLRRTNLFPEEEGKGPITVTYSPSYDSYDTMSRDDFSSRSSLANSMFLVSPLRPLSRQRISVPPPFTKSLRASLIDSSESILRPLTPRNKSHQPKRSLSDAVLLEHDDDNSNNIKDQADINATHSTDFSTSRAQKQTQQSAKTEQEEAKNQWLIPAEHPYKILWDVLTFCLSFANALATHNAIVRRQFGDSWFMTFCEAWFMMDILLNFFTEYRSDTYIIRDSRSVCARYLTTWFVIDVLSLFPGEVVYLKPIIDRQNKRNFFQKNFFRSKAVVRVTRILRGRHFKMFSKASKHTKHAGVGAARLLQLLIKYIPKYLLFVRNMKGVLALRMLRQIHWFRKVWRNFIAPGLSDEAVQPEPPVSLRKLRREYNEDEDGAPF